MKPIIKVHKLSKQYRLGSIGTGTLGNDLKRWWYKIRGLEDPFLKVSEVNRRNTTSDSGYVWALKDISFEVKQGEIVGIIGRNGAGKSTLLKILSKITGPTLGTISYTGRIGSLLEVGTGFHPELTGRENIFLNGAMLGMSRSEIRKKMDEIIDFSGVEKYIDTPIKRYSSGMTIRLGFAVAAHLEPEILIVDEVLAVGDAEFQKKAIGKMQNVSREEGRTILFVSHNTPAIRNLCTSGILLEEGQVTKTGNIDEIIEYYLHNGISNQSKLQPENNIVRKVSASQIGHHVLITLDYEDIKEIRQPILGFVIYDANGNPITGTNPFFSGVNDFGSPKKKGQITAKFSSPCLADGKYNISIWFSEGLAYGNHIFFQEKCLALYISGMNYHAPHHNPSILGYTIPVCEWKFN